MDLSGHMGLQCVWCEKGHGGESLIMWGCASAAGTGKADHVTGTMDSQINQGSLKRDMMPSVKNFNLGDHWTFQQDNDPKRLVLRNISWNILLSPRI